MKLGRRALLQASLGLTQLGLLGKLAAPSRAGGMSASWNLPMVLLSLENWRSPWSTWISTPG